jgi:hypothetical protein
MRAWIVMGAGVAMALALTVNQIALAGICFIVAAVAAWNPQPPAAL